MDALANKNPKFRCRRRWLGMALLCLLLVYAVNLCSADPPPVFPAFNQATVDDLLQNADVDRNCMLLKYGYFLNRRVSPYPVEAGYQDITKYLIESDIGSVRWLSLMSLRGFASFRLDSPCPDVGLDAYSSIFSEAKNTEDPAKLAVLDDSISDFLVTCGGRLRESKPESASGGTAVLIDAWDAYTSALATNSIDIGPDLWVSAAAGTNSTHRLVDEIESSLKAGTRHDLYYLQIVDAALRLSSDPKTSVSLLTRAAQSIPAGSAAREQYDELMIRSLEANGDTEGALKFAVTAVDDSNTGYGRLLGLYGKTHDVKDADDLVSKFKSTIHSDTATLDLIMAFLKCSGDSGGELFSDDAAVNLLRHYIDQRSASQSTYFKERCVELVSLVYLQQRNLESARQLLDAEIPKSPPTDTLGLSEYRRLVAFQDRMATLHGEPGQTTRSTGAPVLKPNDDQH